MDHSAIRDGSGNQSGASSGWAGVEERTLLFPAQLFPLLQPARDQRKERDPDHCRKRIDFQQRLPHALSRLTAAVSSRLYPGPNLPTGKRREDNPDPNWIPEVLHLKALTVVAGAAFLVGEYPSNTARGQINDYRIRS